MPATKERQHRVPAGGGGLKAGLWRNEGTSFLLLVDTGELETGREIGLSQT